MDEEHQRLQHARVRAMAHDDSGSWELSEHDRAALRVVLAELDSARTLVDARTHERDAWIAMANENDQHAARLAKKLAAARFDLACARAMLLSAGVIFEEAKTAAIEVEVTVGAPIEIVDTSKGGDDGGEA